MRLHFTLAFIFAKTRNILAKWKAEFSQKLPLCAGTARSTSIPNNIHGSQGQASGPCLSHYPPRAGLTSHAL